VSFYLVHQPQKSLPIPCLIMQQERVLFHYNGHGVPQPTSNGEIWVFNKNFTQYIPVSIHDLASWLGNPAIYVIDCSHAGLILDSLKTSYESGPQRGVARAVSGQSGPVAPFPRPCSSFGGDPAQETIILAACGANQMLPQDSDLCADIFTACLTTPIKVAMRWCATSRCCSQRPSRQVLGGA
jgi:regulatory associated protein of mTOR